MCRKYVRVWSWCVKLGTKLVFKLHISSFPSINFLSVSLTSNYFLALTAPMSPGCLNSFLTTFCISKWQQKDAAHVKDISFKDKSLLSLLLFLNNPDWFIDTINEAKNLHMRSLMSSFFRKLSHASTDCWSLRRRINPQQEHQNLVSKLWNANHSYASTSASLWNNSIPKRRYFSFWQF